MPLELPKGLMDLKRLWDKIKADKLTQRELAKVAGVHPSQISRYKSGERQPLAHQVEKMANRLSLPISEIMGNGEAEPARKRHGVPQSLNLPEGRATVEYPATLSPQSREALQKWLELIAKLAAQE